MGAANSTGGIQCNSIGNDFELTIRCSKELEKKLLEDWNATGKGIHELVNSLDGRNILSVDLIRHVSRFLLLCLSLLSTSSGVCAGFPVYS